MSHVFTVSQFGHPNLRHLKSHINSEMLAKDYNINSDHSPQRVPSWWIWGGGMEEPLPPPPVFGNFAQRASIVCLIIEEMSQSCKMLINKISSSKAEKAILFLITL